MALGTTTTTKRHEAKGKPVMKWRQEGCDARGVVAPSPPPSPFAESPSWMGEGNALSLSCPHAAVLPLPYSMSITGFLLEDPPWWWVGAAVGKLHGPHGEQQEASFSATQQRAPPPISAPPPKRRDTDGERYHRSPHRVVQEIVSCYPLLPLRRSTPSLRRAAERQTASTPPASPEWGAAAGPLVMDILMEKDGVVGEEVDEEEEGRALRHREESGVGMTPQRMAPGVRRRAAVSGVSPFGASTTLSSPPPPPPSSSIPRLEWRRFEVPPHHPVLLNALFPIYAADDCRALLQPSSELHRDGEEGRRTPEEMAEDAVWGGMVEEAVLENRLCVVELRAALQWMGYADHTRAARCHGDEEGAKAEDAVRPYDAPLNGKKKPSAAFPTPPSPPSSTSLSFGPFHLLVPPVASSSASPSTLLTDALAVHSPVEAGWALIQGWRRRNGEGQGFTVSWRVSEYEELLRRSHRAAVSSPHPSATALSSPVPSSPCREAVCGSATVKGNGATCGLASLPSKAAVTRDADWLVRHDEDDAEWEAEADARPPQKDPFLLSAAFLSGRVASFAPSASHVQLERRHKGQTTPGCGATEEVATPLLQESGPRRDGGALEEVAVDRPRGSHLLASPSPLRTLHTASLERWEQQWTKWLRYLQVFQAEDDALREVVQRLRLRIRPAWPVACAPTENAVPRAMGDEMEGRHGAKHDATRRRRREEDVFYEAFQPPPPSRRNSVKWREEGEEEEEEGAMDDEEKNPFFSPVTDHEWEEGGPFSSRWMPVGDREVAHSVVPGMDADGFLEEENPILPLASDGESLPHRTNPPHPHSSETVHLPFLSAAYHRLFCTSPPPFPTLPPHATRLDHSSFPSHTSSKAPASFPESCIQCSDLHLMMFQIPQEKYYCNASNLHRVSSL